MRLNPKYQCNNGALMGNSFIKGSSLNEISYRFIVCTDRMRSLGMSERLHGFTEENKWLKIKRPWDQADCYLSVCDISLKVYVTPCPQSVLHLKLLPASSTTSQPIRQACPRRLALHLASLSFFHYYYYIPI